MAQTAVTFNVDMLPLGATDSLHVAGNFNDFNYDNVVDNAAYVNWTPNDPNALLTDADGDGVYSITMNLVPDVMSSSLSMAMHGAALKRCQLLAE